MSRWDDRPVHGHWVQNVIAIVVVVGLVVLAGMRIAAMFRALIP